jgi:chloride channel 3/4/5
MVTLLTVSISFFNPFSSKGGTELVYELFTECRAGDSFGGLCVETPAEVLPLIFVLASALVARFLLTIITFGIKLPGTHLLKPVISLADHS